MLDGKVENNSLLFKLISESCSVHTRSTPNSFVIDISVHLITQIRRKKNLNYCLDTYK